MGLSKHQKISLAKQTLQSAGYPDIDNLANAAMIVAADLDGRSATTEQGAYLLKLSAELANILKRALRTQPKEEVKNDKQ